MELAGKYRRLAVDYHRSAKGQLAQQLAILSVPNRQKILPLGNPIKALTLYQTDTTVRKFKTSAAGTFLRTNMDVQLNHIIRYT